MGRVVPGHRRLRLARVGVSPPRRRLGCWCARRRLGAEKNGEQETPPDDRPQKGGETIGRIKVPCGRERRLLLVPHQCNCGQ